MKRQHYVEEGYFMFITDPNGPNRTVYQVKVQRLSHRKLTARQLERRNGKQSCRRRRKGNRDS